eukprot:TRINITY_DN7922_c0_g1_i1.p1 TRINITY_DN7922_c0_g1~~TRINITY_DN7922_c0_g1_i1.p1  ORF type:complete len:184 (-),score=59.00 TRINITY_DN7922_c0_g1_i1:160-711(-)
MMKAQSREDYFSPNSLVKAIDSLGEVVKFIKNTKRSAETVEFSREEIKQGIRHYNHFVSLMKPEINSEMKMSRSLWAEFACGLLNMNDSFRRINGLQKSIDSLRIEAKKRSLEVFGKEDIAFISKENVLLEEFNRTTAILNNQRLAMEKAGFNLASFIKKWITRMQNSRNFSNNNSIYHNVTS